MPKDIGGLSGPSLSFNKHSQYVAERVSGRNNILKALAGYILGTTEENTTDDLQSGRKIDHQLRRTCLESKPTQHNYRKIQCTQNEALRIATGCHKMSQYRPPTHRSRDAEGYGTLRATICTVLARCLEPGNVCHPITTRATPERQMKGTLYTRHRNTVEPMMVKNYRKATLQALHTDAVDKAVKCHDRNVVLDGWPPLISSSEKELTRKERSTLAQLRSRYCRLLGSYKSIIKKDESLNVCADCGTTPHDVKHLFCLPGSPDYNDTVRPMEQTDGRCPGTPLSQGERPRLKLTWTER